MRRDRGEGGGGGREGGNEGGGRRRTTSNGRESLPTPDTEAHDACL